MDKELITFSFGQNWQDYLKTISTHEMDSARKNIEEWLDTSSVSGKTVIDVGCGSGIHSLAFYLLGAEKLYSFDYDQFSVDATKALWEREGKPERWTVSQGSILDKEFIENMDKFDIVYSWGVLHHTGAMWDALEKCFMLVKPGGIFWISLYAIGPRYPQDLALKKKYNSSSSWGKRWMIYKRITVLMLSRLKHGNNPFTWNEKRERGMNVYHDIVDWLGGLPYEVAGEDEVLKFGRQHGLILERIKVKGEGACNIYVFSLPAQ